MKKLFACANAYIKQSSWKDLALIKLCLCAIGVMWGLALPKRTHKTAALVAGLVFVATYIPLMFKFLGIWSAHKTND